MADNVLKKQVVLTAQANEFIYAQPIPAVRKFLDLIHELEVSGQLFPPAAKKITDNLFEMRIKTDANQYRGFYCYAVGNFIYILSGFVKKTQKTPLQEIRKAQRIARSLGL